MQLGGKMRKKLPRKGIQKMKNSELYAEKTKIPGLLIIHLPVHYDQRGWFKENWQKEKMTKLGIADFIPIQNNISFNDKKGTIRGIHAEPWDKLISITSGKIFGGWVDMREGNKHEVVTLQLDERTAVFVPRGVGNSYQTLEDNTVYSYLVNEHWRHDGEYSSAYLFDKEINIPWPIPQNKSIISEKDKLNTSLKKAVLIKPKKVFITGGKGQLGMSLKKYFKNAEYVDLDTFDITNPESYKTINWKDYELVINAAAYTDVDGAETSEGRKLAWNVNAKGLMLLSKTTQENNIVLVHVSSDYVFDGTIANHDEEEQFSPLSVYGEAKAAGDIAAQLTPKHYVVRSSWVVGEGKNFIKTMRELALKSIKPSVVSDQFGRLTFADDLANAIHHLVKNKCEYGIYNFTNDGPVVAWSDLAKMVYEKMGLNKEDVRQVTTKEYYSDKPKMAQRPLNSQLKLDKIKNTGLNPRDWRVAFDEYFMTIKEEL
jgi:dTDP-4-dehydrorhamnose 3,5-epimerase/reductase